MATLAVLGAGSWGTALAVLLSRNGHVVTLWGHLPEHMAVLATGRCNKHYLPGVDFPLSMRVEADLARAVQSVDAVLVVVPSHAFATLLQQLEPMLPKPARLAWATKGLDQRRGQLLHEVARAFLPKDSLLAVLSGPTFAGEVAAGLPTAMTVASPDVDFASDWVGWLHNKQFRAYSSDDIVGVQLGGAVKNVLAIAAGLADGLGFGANARAALITRGLAEMMRLGVAMGGRSETLMGLAGVGDLILTCTDNQSRNRRFGLAVGRGQTREEAVHAIGQEIEGILTARVIYQLAQRHRIDMPISEQIFRILHEQLDPMQAVRNLLEREPKFESSGHLL